MRQVIDLTPTEVDLRLYAGDGALLKLLLKDQAGQPMDVSGDAFEADIRVQPSDSTEAVTFDVDLTDAATGVVALALTGAQTADLVNGTDFLGVWDVQWIASGAEPRTLVRGKVQVPQDVTR